MYSVILLLSIKLLFEILLLPSFSPTSIGSIDDGFGGMWGRDKGLVRLLGRLMRGGVSHWSCV